MVNRVLAAIDRKIDQSRSRREQLILFAERACVLARLGRTDAAKEVIAQLRKENPNYEPELTAWILLGEGMVDHFSTWSVAALDKFRRAYGISTAWGVQPLASRCAAWLASSEFKCGNAKVAADLAVRAISSAPEDDHGTLARARLVIADCLSNAGMITLAQGHYSSARRHASIEGDLSMQSAVLHNHAAFRVARVVLADALSLESTEDQRLVKLDVESTANLDVGVGIASLSSPIPLLRAQLLTVERSWPEALELFESHIESSRSHGQRSEAAKFFAHKAYCFAQIGNLNASSLAIDMSLSEIDACSDFDDLAITHARLAGAYTLQGNETSSSEHGEAAKRCLAHYQEQQAINAAALSALPLLNGSSETAPSQ